MIDPGLRRDYRVLLVDLARSFGGAEVRVLTQARALQTAIAGCAVATLEGSLLHQRLIAERLPHVPVKAGRANPRMILRLREMIRAGGFTVVDAHNVQSILWAHLAAVWAGARGRVATIHSDYGREYPGPKGWAYESVLWLDRWLSRQMITVTEVLQAKAERQGLAARSTLIHNAVPVPEQPWGDPEQTLRVSWGFSPEDIVVAIVARLKPVKGHRYLIDAMSRLGDLPRLKLLIVGDGPLLPELETQVAAAGLAGRVVFAGFRQDVDAVLRSVDAVCMASLSEALPYAVLEAMAWARPLVVTDVGGLATLLSHRQTAYLVPPADADALAQGLRWLVTHPHDAHMLGLAGYQKVRDQFSVGVMIGRVVDVYDRALAP